MKVVLKQETTDWKIPTVKNHVYAFIDSNRIVGYIKHGERKIFVFKKPYLIDTRGRDFVTVSQKNYLL